MKKKEKKTRVFFFISPKLKKKTGKFHPPACRLRPSSSPESSTAISSISVKNLARIFGFRLVLDRLLFDFSFLVSNHQVAEHTHTHTNTHF